MKYHLLLFAFFLLTLTPPCWAQQMLFVDFSKSGINRTHQQNHPRVIAGDHLKKYLELYKFPPQSSHQIKGYFSAEGDLIGGKNFPYSMSGSVRGVDNNQIIFLEGLGTESGSGGGGAAFFNSQLRLIDFFTLPENYNPILTEPNSFSSLSNLHDINERVINILKDWENLSSKTILPTIFTPTLAGSLGVSSFILLDSLKKEVDHFIHPSLGITENSVQTMAIYTKDNNGFKPILVNRNILLMPALDQTGILLHEVLRHVQISLGAGFNDEVLQQVTSLLLVCRPDINLSYYTFALINNNMELAMNSYGNFHSVIKKWCEKKP